MQQQAEMRERHRMNPTHPFESPSSTCLYIVVELCLSYEYTQFCSASQLLNHDAIAGSGGPDERWCSVWERVAGEGVFVQEGVFEFESWLV
jgi:hypothetical protein